MAFSERPTPLPAEKITARLDPGSLPFASTADAGFEPFHGVIGQQVAREAIAFGVSMARPGYNIFVSGEPGTGRLSLVRHYLEAEAKAKEPPSDWLYVNQFENLREPIALALPPGLGKDFLADMEHLVDSLFATFPAAFEHPAYQRGKAGIEREFALRYNRAIDAVERRAQAQGVALFRDGDTISFSPVQAGKVASEEEFSAWPEAEKEAFHAKAIGLEDFLAESLVELPQWRRESRERLGRLNRETLDQAIGPLLAPLGVKFADQPDARCYLDELRRDLPCWLLTAAEWQQPDAGPDTERRSRLVERYVPRLLVSHGEAAGAPVIFEANPTYQNLFGQIEYTHEQGMLTTHHRLICPGALHGANGGYLVLEADKMVAEPQVWPALKRALKSRLVRIEPPVQDQSVPAAMSLSPQPIPFNLKLVLVGGRDLYYLLQELDGEFNELFRVLADFDDHLPRDDESITRMVGLMKAHAECSGFAPISASAASRLLEYSGRLAEHQRRLSARIGDVCELVAEAELIRRQTADPLIEETHVAAALADREMRLGRVSRRLLEEMLEGVILIGTSGEAVGRVNGLTVLDVGGSRFGMPARISAVVSPGGRGVVDIEREAQLGQAIHSKGVMILSGYLAHKYAQDFPLRLSATLAMEQSYGYVDGDSASLAELLALISALTGVPVLQSLAVTGSINQYGEVQAVGGVNEKIEGFFQLCQARGLGGGQGVVIPAANASNLMLSRHVVDAVRQGLFGVYPVSTVEQALGLLTAKPPASIDQLALARLRAMAEWKEERGQQGR